MGNTEPKNKLFRKFKYDLLIETIRGRFSSSFFIILHYLAAYFGYVCAIIKLIISCTFCIVLKHMKAILF